MFEPNPGVPQQVLSRLGHLVGRCASEVRDDSARVALSRLATDCGESYPGVALEAIATLARDAEVGVREAASRDLEELLGALDGLARMSVAVSWATSDDARLRLAAARALGGETEVLGIVSMLDQLTRDGWPEVRYAACVSCATWIGWYPRSLSELLSICATDKNASISSAAVAGLRGASHGPASGAAARALGALASSANRHVAEAARSALDERGA